MTDAQMYIDGKWLDASDGGRIRDINPATGLIHATVPSATVEDVDTAVLAARRTFDDGIWSIGTAERARGHTLIRAAEIIRRRAEELARLETLDSGKPIGESRDDVEEAAFMFEYYGGWATKVSGDIPPVGPDAMSLVVREPAGVAAAITPWNYPLVMASQKVAPALAAGCSVVLKPASFTPLTALTLGSVLEEAGVPAGVFNVITGAGASVGSALATHPDTDIVSVTGSVDVGKAVMRQGADTLKRVTLELGGKSPNIFFADADFEAAVAGSCDGIFWNQGEICSAGSRVLVQKSIYDEALQAMVEYGAKIRLGDGMDPETTMGPLVSSQHRESVLGYIEIGKSEGAKVALSGEAPSDPALANGYFVPPTIFSDVHNDMRIAREEIFGPVMSVIPFEDADDAIRIANDSSFGLAAAIWTSDITKAMRTAKAIKAGVVWINDTQPAPTEAPWGGYKQSGVGRELGSWGLEDYLEVKHIWVSLSGA